MKVKILILTLFLFLFLGKDICAQSNKEILKKAHHFFENGQYIEAANNFEKVWSSSNLNTSNLFEAAFSFRNCNKLDLSIDALQKLIKKSKGKKEYILLLAQTLQQNRKFFDAAVQYKNYLKEIKKSNPHRISIEQEILKCTNGLKLSRKENVAIVEGLGTNVNTIYDEFAPAPSINFIGKYYFSAFRPTSNVKNRKNQNSLQSDIFTIEDNNGNWSSIQGLGEPFESEKNEEILDLVQHGNGIMFLRSSNDQDAEIRVKLFNNNNIEDEPVVDLPLNIQNGDKDLCFFQDSILIFSSNRPGGFGAYDLYLSIKRNGKWLESKNLGINVNSPFDEINPFIAKDGQTLYFSSNDLQSIGGYDIFKVKYLPESRTWTSKENIGLPINSAGNEWQFKLDRLGRSAVFCSDRWDKSKGGKDIFIAYFKDEIEEQFNEESGTVLPIFYADHSDFNKQTEYPNPLIESFVKYKELGLDYISCAADDFLSNNKSQNALNDLIKILKNNPSLNLNIIAHSNESANEMINLFTSIKKSNEVFQFCVDKGIQKSRIGVIGCGGEYLIYNSGTLGVSNSVSSDLNNRIEFQLIFNKDENYRVNYTSIKLNEGLKINSLYKFQKDRSELTYSILLGESTQMLNKDFPRWDTHNKFVEQRNNKYYYFVGNFKSFNDAKKFIVDSSLPIGSIIQAFYDGRYLDNSAIINYVDQHPDLILLINYNKTIK